MEDERECYPQRAKVKNNNNCLDKQEVKFLFQITPLKNEVYIIRQRTMFNLYFHASASLMLKLFTVNL